MKRLIPLLVTGLLIVGCVTTPPISRESLIERNYQQFVSANTNEVQNVDVNAMLRYFSANMSGFSRFTATDVRIAKQSYIDSMIMNGINENYPEKPSSAEIDLFDQIVTDFVTYIESNGISANNTAYAFQRYAAQLIIRMNEHEYITPESN